jgi:hypothetical protein
VNRFGRDEPMLVVTHMCMAAMPGISLYSYINLKLVTIVFLILSHVFLDKIRTRGQNRFFPEIGQRGTQTMYTHGVNVKTIQFFKGLQIISM